MENVSRCDTGREWCAKNTRRELHAVKKLADCVTWIWQGLETTAISSSLRVASTSAQYAAAENTARDFRSGVDALHLVREGSGSASAPCPESERKA